jgi:uncharacterized RDD family membrane protein YckC
MQTEAGPIAAHAAVPATSTAAGLAVRAVAVILDAIIAFFGLGIAIGLAAGQTHHSGGSFSFNLHGPAALALFVAVFAYWVVGEHVFGTTIGKRIFGIRVVGADGGNPSWGAAIVRTLFRIVDSFPYVVPYLVGFISAISGSGRQRIGDRVAGTRVVQR